MAANGVTVYAVWALDNNGPHDPTDPEVTPSEPGDPDATPDYYEYGILYDGNGATGGDVPVDGALYPVNGSVTVMGNPGGLVRDGAVFLGWSLTEQALIASAADELAAGILTEGETVTMAATGVTVYAVWALDGNGPHDPTDPEVTPSEPGDPDATPDYYEYGILYDGNGATGGDVPVDGALYPVNGRRDGDGEPGRPGPGRRGVPGLEPDEQALIASAADELAAGILTEGETVTMAANGVTVYAVWALDNNGPHDPTDPEVTPSEPGDPDATPDYYEYGILYDDNGATGGDVPVTARCTR